VTGQAGLLNRSDLVVLLVLERYLDRDLLEAWPSVKTLAGEAGLARQTVHRSLRHLHERRLVTSRREVREGRRGPLWVTVYRLVDAKAMENLRPGSETVAPPQQYGADTVTG